MITPPLLRHGQHIKPHYRTSQKSSTDGFAKNPSQTIENPHRADLVKRYDKKTPASKVPTAVGLIDQKFRDAISYSKTLPEAKGIPLAIIVIVFLMLMWPITVKLKSTYFFLIDFIGLPLILIGMLALMVFAVRLELYRLSAEPIIFDRKHRSVYRLFIEQEPGFIGLFARWPVRALQFDWDLIDVEHCASLATTGATVRRNHALIFIVRKGLNDPTIIDSFNIGTSDAMITDDAVDAIWEHIRRFMEADGPHLPFNESLPLAVDPEPSLLKRLYRISPLTSFHWSLWRDHLPMMLLFLILLPLSLPFVLMWQFFNWLAYKTSKPAAWPSEVIDNLGSSSQNY
jgi:hypothetical protein